MLKGDNSSVAEKREQYMYAKHILKEKAREAKGLLLLSLRLARMGRWQAVEAAIHCVWNLFIHSPTPHLFQTEIIRPLRKEREERLAALLEKIPERALRESQYIREHKFPASLRGLVYSQIQPNLSIFLDEKDPATLFEYDNLLLDAEIPLESFQPAKQNFARRMGWPQSFTEMALECAWPMPDASLLAAAEAVWLDLNASYWLGVKFPQTGAPIFMTEEEVGSLLSWRQTAANLFGEAVIRHDPQYAAGGIDLIRKLLCHIDELADAITYEVPPSIYAYTFKRLMTCLNKVRKEMHHLTVCADRTAGRKKSDQDSLLIKHAHSEDDFGRKNILKLDQAMRLLEPAAKSVFAEANEIVCAEIPFDDAFLPENNPPEIENLTLWTKANGDLAQHFIGLPIISVTHPCGSLLCSGEDWSETPEIERMVYLTHTIAHDSPVSWGAIGRTDYVTLRVDCGRQAYSRLNEY